MLKCAWKSSTKIVFTCFSMWYVEHVMNSCKLVEFEAEGDSSIFPSQVVYVYAITGSEISNRLTALPFTATFITQ